MRLSKEDSIKAVDSFIAGVSVSQIVASFDDKYGINMVERALRVSILQGLDYKWMYLSVSK